MKAHEDEHEVNQMAELMSVSRSGFYPRRAGRKSARAQEDEVLSGRIERIHCRSRGTYGSPRITRKLAREGTRLGNRRRSRGDFRLHRSLLQSPPSALLPRRLQPAGIRNEKIFLPPGGGKGRPRCRGSSLHKPKTKLNNNSHVTCLTLRGKIT